MTQWQLQVRNSLWNICYGCMQLTGVYSRMYDPFRQTIHRHQQKERCRILFGPEGLIEALLHNYPSPWAIAVHVMTSYLTSFA